MPATVKDITGKDLSRSSAKDDSGVQPYLREFGLQRNPFPVVPDAVGFYLSPRNETIVAEVLHVIESRKGFVVITGEVGLGKTTLSRRLLSELENQGVQTALVFNTFYQGAELLSEINKDFGISTRANDLQSQMSALNDFLLKNLALGVNCVIVIDDAQQLSIESLELLRQVSNLETDSEKLVQILLFGQPELDAKLKTHELRQLASRIALRHFVTPYSLLETSQYVQFKLAHAGGQGRLPLTASAYRLLQRLSNGNPRQINFLMDRCLYAGIAYGRDKIDRPLLAAAARDAHTTSSYSLKLRGELLVRSAAQMCRATFARFADKVSADSPYSPELRGEKLPGKKLPGKLLAQSVVVMCLAILLGGLLLNRSDDTNNQIQVSSSASDPSTEPGSLLVATTTDEIDTGISIAAVDNSSVTVGSSNGLSSSANVSNVGEPVAKDQATHEQAVADELELTLVATGVATENADNTVVILDQVEPFLRAYNLAQYASGFNRALNMSWTDEIAEEIVTATGFRLVSLSEMPDGLERYPVMSLAGPEIQEDKYFLFWRPEIWTQEHFSYFYRTDEVLTLQQALHLVGHYTGNIDGLVGPLTSAAVRRFQATVNLPSTGKPDTATLFLLEHLIASENLDAPNQESLL